MEIETQCEEQEFELVIDNIIADLIDQIDVEDSPIKIQELIRARIETLDQYDLNAFKNHLNKLIPTKDNNSQTDHKFKDEVKEQKKLISESPELVEMHNRLFNLIISGIPTVFCLYIALEDIISTPSSFNKVVLISGILLISTTVIWEVFNTQVNTSPEIDVEKLKILNDNLLKVYNELSQEIIDIHVGEL